MFNSPAHDPQAEAREIAERFPAWPTGWGLELRNRVIEEIATALAAKDAELAKRPDWATVNATYEKWKARAERAEAQLAEANKALEPFAIIAGLLDGKWLGHETHRSPAYSRTEITIGDLRAARRALTGGRDDA